MSLFFMAGHHQRSSSIWSRLVLGVLIAMLPMAGSATHATGIEEWRVRVDETRDLAENDTRSAYEAAKKLQAELPAGATPADRARVLNLLGRIEAYIGLTSLSAGRSQEAYGIAVRHDDRVGQAEADLNVAINSVNLGRMDDVVRATQHSVQILEGVDRPDLLGEAMMRAAVMYRRFDQIDESTSVAVRAVQIGKRSGNALARAYAYQAIALAFDQSDRSQESRENYLQMRAAAREAQSRLMEGFALMGQGKAEMKAGDFAQAEQLFRQAVGIFRGVGANFAECAGVRSLGELRQTQGRHAQALAFLDEAMAIYTRYPNPIGEWYLHNARSTSLQAMGDLANARAQAERGYGIAKNLGLPLYLSGSATRLALVAAAAGDHRRAYELTLEASEMTGRMTRERAGKRLVDLLHRYEQESKEREYEELARRAERQAAQQRWLLTILAAVVVLLGAAAMFAYRLRQGHRELEHLNEQLTRSETDIRALNATLEQRVQSRTAELRQQARYLRTLIDMLPMSAWLKDTNNRYLAANQATARACGTDVDQIVGRTDGQLWPRAQAEHYRREDEQIMASGRGTTVEEQIVVAGTPVWMESYKAPVIDEDGTVLGMVGVSRDISDRKAAEVAREAALAEARRLAQQRSDFLAQMSHELRTPLNGILGFAQILQRDNPLTERQCRGLRVIEESGQHLLTLINDVLDLARIDAAKLELSPTEITLPAFLRGVSDIVYLKAEEKGLSFEYRPGPGLPWTIWADERRLRQVLLNLLSNAIKFTDMGRVRLSVGVLAPQGGDGAGDIARLRFEVHDTGIGLDESQRARLFLPFEQVAGAARGESGAGLGLAISRQLVRLMGGDIHVDSEPGRGSTFSFELEVSAAWEEASGVPRAGKPVGYEGRRRTVLIVDDVAPNRAMLNDALTMLGFDVYEAADGQEGIDVAAQRMPQLIIMDLAMATMDGFEAMRRIRSMAALAEVPIIATSASATTEMEARSRGVGANAFIAKPLEQAALLRTIGSLLGLSWMYEQSPAEQEAGSTGREGPLVAPPADEMAVLRQLAKMGNMRAIRERAEHLKGLDPCYMPFANRLARLADGYQSRAIAHLVETHSAPLAEHASTTLPSAADGSVVLDEDQSAS
jgi:PAS domain S-box-containing protein